MASDIRIEVGFFDHPKTVMLSRRVGPRAAEHVMRLWFWTAGHRPDGDLSGFSDEMIEIACRWEGEPGKLVEAMRSVGFLDGEENARRVHEWAEHQPWVANREVRTHSARNAAVARWEKLRNAEPMRPACDPHADRNAPNPTQPNPNPTHEKPKAPARASLALPDWLPVEQWGGFVEMRKRIKAPLTDRAVTLAIGELEKLRAQGQDVGAVLDQSVANGWKGLFPLKSNGFARAAPRGDDFGSMNYGQGGRL